MQNRGTTWESGLTHLSVQVTGNLGGHGHPGRAVVSMPHVTARSCSVSSQWHDSHLLEKHEFVSEKLRSGLASPMLNGDVTRW